MPVCFQMAEGKTGLDAAAENSFGCREYHLGKDRDVRYLFENLWNVRLQSGVLFFKINVSFSLVFFFLGWLCESGVAITSKDTAKHCPHAALLGGGVGACSSPLQAEQYTFCMKYKSSCGKQPYVNCEAAVSAMTVGAKTDRAVDTWQCRNYHIGVPQSGTGIETAKVPTSVPSH